MSLILSQNAYAIVPGMTAFFAAVTGTAPFVYSVRPGGAGGSVDSSTGVYTAPANMPVDPGMTVDTIQVIDNVGAIATAQIKIGTPIFLLCEIIQRELDLSDDHVYLWDQKVMQPIDSDLYVAVSVPSCKPFGNILQIDGSGSGLDAEQSITMQALVDIDIISRSAAARDQKEQVLMALYGIYSQQQQEINSFHISRLSPGGRFINLSMVDGAAIPYRYKISVMMQYAVKRTKAVQYYDTFSPVSVATNA